MALRRQRQSATEYAAESSISKMTSAAPTHDASALTSDGSGMTGGVAALTVTTGVVASDAGGAVPRA